MFHAGRFCFLGMHEVMRPMGFDHVADAATIAGNSASSFGIDEGVDGGGAPRLAARLYAFP